MNPHVKTEILQNMSLTERVNQACLAVAPVWPLRNTVAVNPFFGQAGLDFAQTSDLYRRLAGTDIAMPAAWYRQKLQNHEITHGDIAEAVDTLRDDGVIDGPTDQWTPYILLATLDGAMPEALPTLADLATRQSGFDWTRVIGERIGSFAAAFYDQGQALWARGEGQGLYHAWHDWALHDASLSFSGHGAISARIKTLPQNADQLISVALEQIGLAEACEAYLIRLLFSLKGWAQVARQADWQSDLDGKSGGQLRELLAVRLAYELLLHSSYGEDLAGSWQAARMQYRKPAKSTQHGQAVAILQLAHDLAVQRRLTAQLAAVDQGRANGAGEARPALQAAFCIDVRSEVIRRALEQADHGMVTTGFAGFFGLGLSYRAAGSALDEARLPVLLKPKLFACEAITEPEAARRNILLRVKRAFGRFKQAAVSSFAFVEAAGPLYALSLAKHGLGLAAAPRQIEGKPRLDPPLSLAERVAAARTILAAMSLPRPYARLVLIAGHGASMINNPFASAYQCGACGGHSGEVNARLLADLLNDRAVRAELASTDLSIPDDTCFLAGCHDTISDAVALFEEDIDLSAHESDLVRLRKALLAARQAVRQERASRLPGATLADVAKRASDWSETRPEWGLAGCRAFVAAPRSRTTGRDLQGQVFLHDYDHHRDNDRSVLELILTAPVVVASWISLQYFGSTVAPQMFGAGNKLLHNPVGGLGVLEGSDLTLRTGLPLQALHDGEGFAHDPVRLTVMIDAPLADIARIVDSHPHVRDLFGQSWLHLMAWDEKGVLHRYRKGGHWQVIDNATQSLAAEHAPGAAAA